MKKQKKREIYLLVIDALQTDGAHHKQWYLERILEALGYDIDAIQSAPTWDDGIAP